MEQNGVKQGLFMGLVIVLATLVAHTIDRMSIDSWMVALPTWLAYIYFIVNAGQTEKKNKAEALKTETSDEEGVLDALYFDKSGSVYITFKELIKPTFLSYAIGSFIITVFSYVLYNYVDPELFKEITEKTLYKTLEWLEYLGTPQEAIEQSLEEFDKQIENASFGFGSAIMGYAISLFIPGFLIAAVVSLVLQKKAPK